MASEGQLESLWVAVDGRRLHARVSAGPVPAGAPAVVLVHGLGVSSSYMLPLARNLAPHCRVLAPDLPGFGKSAHPPRVLDVPELADALVAWMTAVRLPRAALVCNSMGCQIAVDCAVRYPERVERLVLQGVTMDPAARSVPAQLGRLAVAALRAPVSSWFVVMLDYWRCRPWRALQTLRYALRDRIEDKLPHVRAPALVVHGTRDPIAPRPWAEQVASLLPQGQLVELPGAGHIPNYARPEELARAVLPFLRGGARPGAVTTRRAAWPGAGGCA